MSFDIGDLFYIILTLIFVFAGAFGKKKKPAQQTRIPQSNTEEGVPVGTSREISSKIDDLFREYLDDDLVVKEQKTSEEYTREADQEMVSAETSREELSEYEAPAEPSYSGYEAPAEPVYAEIVEERSIEEGFTDERKVYDDFIAGQDSDPGRIIDEIRDSEGMGTDEHGHDEDLNEIVENFNPRKAFIYSEIFNRKITA